MAVKFKKWYYIQLTFGIWWGPFSLHPVPPARHQPHPLAPPTQTIIQEERKNPVKRSNSQQTVLYCLGLSTQNPGLREVDLEPSPKRGTIRIKALVSLYWSSWSLLLKQSLNIVLNKLTLVNPIKSPQTWKEINKIPELHALQHIKINFPKTTN